MKPQQTPAKDGPDRERPSSPNISPGAPPHTTDTRRPPQADELPVPHEHDEAPGTNEHPDTRGPRQVIDQASSDIGRGLRDTDRRGTPSDVPGPGPAPEESPGAAVPPEGVDRAGYTRKHDTPPPSPDKPPKD